MVVRMSPVAMPARMGVVVRMGLAAADDDGLGGQGRGGPGLVSGKLYSSSAATSNLSAPLTRRHDEQVPARPAPATFRQMGR